MSRSIVIFEVKIKVPLRKKKLNALAIESISVFILLILKHSILVKFALKLTFDFMSDHIVFVYYEN